MWRWWTGGDHDALWVRSLRHNATGWIWGRETGGEVIKENMRWKVGDGESIFGDPWLFYYGFGALADFD